MAKIYANGQWHDIAPLPAPRQDITFTSSELNDQSRYVVVGAKAADVVVVDPNGQIQLPDIYQVGDNVEIDFTEWTDLDGTWTIQFTSGDASAPDFETAMMNVIGEA